jgi:heat shock protein HslJ
MLRFPRLLSGLVLTLGLSLGLAALPAPARDLTGSLLYKERIALPPGGELVVELRAEGVILGELREPVGDRQVPLAFTLSTGQTGPLTLRGAILLEGKPVWSSDPVTVPPGEDTLDLGPLPLLRQTDLGFARAWRCGSVMVEIGRIPGGGLRLASGGKLYHLAATATGFSDGETPPTTLTAEGNRSRVSLSGAALPECEPTIDTGPLPLTARGHEPGWVLTLARQGVTLSTQEGETLAAALPPVDLTSEGAVVKIAPDLVAVVTETLCHDAMTGLPYPASVTLNREAGSLQGCGGDPLALLQGNWVVTEVAGEPLPAAAETTLSVTGARVAGVSACNRYTGSIVLTGEGLQFPRLAGTMMACAEDLMAAEARFLKAMSEVTGFDLDEEGNLLLLVQDRIVIRARP